MEQQVHFCTVPDGIRLAYAAHGSGPPIVRTATWLTHLDYDWESPVWRHWLDTLSDGHTLVRYDERGCGLSDREPGGLSLETWVADLEAVVAAAGVDRFALLGVSQGAAIATVYAARHPERLTHLVLYGGSARGRMYRGADERRHAEAMLSAIRAGWTETNPAFRHLFSTLFLPHGTPEQMAWHDELQRRSTAAATAARLYEARNAINVVDYYARLTTPTLVMHARGDRAVPSEESRLLAAGILGARLVLLESENHILLSDEPAWEDFQHVGPDLLENAGDACGPDLAANIAAVRRFLRASTAHPLTADDWTTALCWNMAVPAAVRQALFAREIHADDVLAGLSVPVLVTHGRSDAIVLPSMAEHVLAVCRTAEASWYDGVGHTPFAEDPARFDSELGEFTARAA